MSGVVLVTGGSRGIGAAVSRLAAERGYAVCINYLAEAPPAEALAAEIAAAGGKALLHRADITDEAQVLEMFEAVDAELGPLTGLINNAGITGGFIRVEDLDAETLRRVLEINVVGAFFCAREAVRRMSTKHGGAGGSIVNVSSMAAMLGSAGEYVHYAASKGAIDSMTVGLAREVASEGIRVNAVNPGIIDTEIHARAGFPDRVRQKGATLPMGRGGTAEEVAEAVLWLLSDASSFSTGVRLPVNGGA